LACKRRRTERVGQRIGLFFSVTRFCDVVVIDSSLFESGIELAGCDDGTFWWNCFVLWSCLTWSFVVVFIDVEDDVNGDESNNCLTSKLLLLVYSLW